MDQLLKKLHTQFKLLEDLTDLTPEEEKEFKERMAAEREKESRYQEYKNAQQGDDSSNSGGDVTKMSASELVKELNDALDREGIEIPDSGGNQVEDILAAIQAYKKSAGLATDADALVSLLGLKPPPRTPQSPPFFTDANRPPEVKPNADNKPNADIKPTAPDPTDMGGASELGGAPEPEISKTFTPYGDKLGQYTRTGVDAASKLAGNAADEISNAYTNVSNAFSGIGNGFSRGFNRTNTKESVVYPRLSESDEMARLVSRLTRLDEPTQLNEVKFPPAVEKFLNDYGGIFGRKTDKELADVIGNVAKIRLNGKEIPTGWTRYSDTEYVNANREYLTAKQLLKRLDKEGAELERNFGVSSGTQVTSKTATDKIENYTKNADGSWTDHTGNTLARGSNEANALEKRAQQELTGTTPSTTNTNPSTTNPTSSIVSPQRAKELAAETNFLKTNSLPANLSWAAKSKRFLKYSAALAALGLVFDNGELIWNAGKKLLGLGGADPAGAGGAGGAAGNTAAADAKNSEEIKDLVKKIQALENDHGKDSDPAWSKAVEHANAVFKRLGIPPFDNSIPKPKPVAPAPRPVAPPAPVAAASAVPPESVVPQDMVQPVDLQQNYQQQPVNQRNSNTFIPIPIPLGGFGGGRGNGGGRGPQNGRGYPGAGGQIRGGVGTPGGGNRGGRR